MSSVRVVVTDRAHARLAATGQFVRLITDEFVTNLSQVAEASGNQHLACLPQMGSERKRDAMKNAIAAALVSALLVGCAAESHVIVGTVRPPISPDQVKIYLQPPRVFEKIAIIDASSQSSMAFTQQQKMDKAIARLKDEAAKLGANGILLQGTGSQAVGSVGTGFGSATATGSSEYGTGVGVSGNVFEVAPCSLTHARPSVIQPASLE